MCILRDKKLLFVHIPKCAGTTVEKIFLEETKSFLEVYPKLNLECLTGIYKNKILNHLKLNDFNEFVNIDDYYKFTIFRNPVDRLISAYNFEWSTFHPERKKCFSHYLNLVEKNNKDLLEKNHYNYLYVEPQYKYFENNKLNKIIKFDNLNYELKELLDKFKIKIKIGHHKNVKKILTINDLTKNDIERIKKIYKKDYEIYNSL